MKRARFFVLTQIQMPVGAVASIAHRISGILLALGIPFLLGLFDLSLRGQAGFDRVSRLFAAPLSKLAAFVYVWALAHHAFAGVRHLLSDIDVGSRLRNARRSAWVVNVAGIAVALLALGAMI